MRRLAPSSFILFCAFATSAWAEKITVEQTVLPDTEILVNVLDPAVQSAVIADAQFDWSKTSGADVWWVWLDDIRVQVMVFSSLQRPGVGQPQCCLHFTVGDLGTDFWLKLESVRPGWAQHETILSGITPGNLPEDSPAILTHVTVAESLTVHSDSNVASAGPENDVVVPVPEPSSLFLVGSGLVAVIRRRRLS